MTTDRISSLPIDIRSRIMSFLPIEDAMRACILSKEWRYVCASLSIMNFELYDNRRSNFRDFVNGILLRHDGTNIEKFRLVVLTNENGLISTRSICSWISFALHHNIQELELSLGFIERMKLPYEFYVCSLLNVLKLVSIEIEWPVTFKFQILKKLYLEKVSFSNGDIVHSLFSASVSPLLEDLEINSCELNSDILKISDCRLRSVVIIDMSTIKIKIAIPGLQKLECACWKLPSITFSTAVSLIEVCLDTRLNDEEYSASDLASHFHWMRIFLMHLYNVKRLNLNPVFIEFFSWGRHMLYSSIISVDYNIRHLCIGFFKSEKHLKTLERLLGNCTWLEILEITVIEKGWDLDIIQLESMKNNVDENYWRSKTYTGVTLSYLRKFEMKQFGGSDFEDSLVKYIIGNSQNLEKLVFSYPYDDLGRIRSQRIQKKWLLKYGGIARDVSISFI